MESKEARKSALEKWLITTIAQPFTLSAMAHDASFRRYYRVSTKNMSFVAMDAPPAQENTAPFMAITRALRQLGLNSPEIIGADTQQGFLLITDFGDTTYLSALNAQNADPLYQKALQALAVLQGCRAVPDYDIPIFTSDFMWKEWAWHKEWFAEKFLGLDAATLAPLDACYEKVVTSATQQPQVFMHRDYHSGNLMVLPEQVGILDFQDAFIGPVTYDPVSLLRDCYISWPEADTVRWVRYYWQTLKDQGMHDASFDTFERWFDWMGVQRHLKALMTFARKYVRDHQPQYLPHMPRTLKYLLSVGDKYSDLMPLRDYLALRVMPLIKESGLISS